jgi:hypothetical protein
MRLHELQRVASTSKVVGPESGSARLLPQSGGALFISGSVIPSPFPRVRIFDPVFNDLRLFEQVNNTAEARKSAGNRVPNDLGSAV